MDWERCAEHIFESVGGKENISDFSCCSTRLIIVIKDLGNVNLEQLKSLDGVERLSNRDGELQLTLGTGNVVKAFNSFVDITGLKLKVRENEDEPDFIEIKKNNETPGEVIIESPVKGTMINVEDIKDDNISSGILGQGFGVIPCEGIVRAPFDGTVLSVFPTFHAIGIKADNGMQILIHIGVNTSKLDGKYFEALVKQGDQIKKDQELIVFDLESIRNENYDVTTAVLITNHEDFNNIKFVMTQKERLTEEIQ